MADVSDETERLAGGSPEKASTITFERLKKLNRIAAGLHFVQFVFMLAACLAVEQFRDFKLMITHVYWVNVEYKGLVSTVGEVGKMPIGPLVAIFFLLSAVFQGLTTVGKWNDIYVRDLERSVNRFRWYEYSISSSLMIVIIALFVGINDIGYLLCIFFLNMCMNLFGLLMETGNSGKPFEDITWAPFWFGSIAGGMPWIAVFISLFVGAAPPAFVYGIFISYFIMFQTFPINMALQYKKVGKWKDYLYGEVVYIWLSLIAKTLLGWLVFGGLNQPNEANGGT